MCDKNELDAYQQAAADFIAAPTSDEPVAKMMSLACEAKRETIRRWAAGWLLVNCNVAVVTDDAQGGSGDAATSKTASLS